MQREPYFTPGTIQAVARAMLEPLAPLHARHADQVFMPDRAALLVLDMQDYFLEPASHAFIPAAPAILPNITKLIQSFSSSHRPIIFTRHLNTPADAGGMSRWWRDLLHPDSPLSRISSALDSSSGIHIEKGQYDAFHGTQLEQVLRSRDVEQLVITGVMTHLCCETTARAAFMRGFAVFFCVDGTATYNRDFHQASLLNLAHGFALPILVEELRF
jgi:isochorismate hydrolase